MDDLNKELKELKNKCNELEEKIRKLKLNEKRWRAGKGGDYYYILSTGQTGTDRDCGFGSDNDKYNIGNYFKTREEAERTAAKIKIYMQLKELALRLNKDEEIDWQDYTQNKYYIYYDYADNKIRCSNSRYFKDFKDIGQIYCLNENFLNIAKQEIGENNLKKLFDE